jgi:kanamycin kinase
VIAHRPADAPSTPAAVRSVLGDGPIEVVWRNELGGLTFRAERAGAVRYLKWAPTGSGVDFAAEIERLTWLAGRWPAPELLGHGADSTAGWVMTRGIPGENAVEPRWRARPADAVRAIGAGLRAMHDALPVAQCPFDWSIGARLADLHVRAAAGAVTSADFAPEHSGLSVADALARLQHAPDVDRLVVCHGDACAPNTLIDASGRWSGHVDFGCLGVADRWADLAVATWSTQWNYGPGWEAELLAAYGVEADPERTAYYRLLWDLGP